LEWIDRMLPPDLDWKALRGRSESRDRMLCFTLAFEETESEEAWQRLLDIAEHGTLVELSNQITQQAGTSDGEKPSN
jgi:hypothetical protein